MFASIGFFGVLFIFAFIGAVLYGVGYLLGAGIRAGGRSWYQGKQEAEQDYKDHCGRT